MFKLNEMGRLLITYGTLTMNSEMVATKMYEVAEESGQFENVELKNLMEFIEVPEEIANYDNIIIGTSTWGEGEYPPDTEDFMNNLKESTINIEGKKVAFFGLGDSSYEVFCGSIDTLSNYFVDELKVQKVGEILKIDGFPDDDVLETASNWLKGILPLFS